MSNVINLEEVSLEDVSVMENVKKLIVVGLTNSKNHRFEVTHDGECFSVDFFSLKNDEGYDVSARSNGNFVETVNAAREYITAPVNVNLE